MKIGIGITSHNRGEMAEYSISKWKQFLPVGTNLAIIDDGSTVPLKSANYRFEEKQGISIAKNKCLELLEDNDHIFLVDDDIYPLNDIWIGKYVFSNLQHACYIFDRKLLSWEPNYHVYDLPRGCLLYFTKRCIEIAGGFDTNFTNCYEHAELSRRIFNMGLTPAPYIDIPNSAGLFYSHDEQGTGQSSFDPHTRGKAIRSNKQYWEETKLSNQFIPYK